ncbi:hypothetical protein H6F75_27095 [Nodosilinea sp. FACHB-131]|uniref:hypothetical protein n=1 Tax=Cyanophyceae TaxID=3028117 RepID=UPI0016860B02|nr:hypothetical protein [Nodosilinea sp. FACHB-131]MBD1877154.1 hypothetical protein [Nodosilinea sp. FACHB-131]
MGSLDKDLFQKQSAIRFCLLTQHLPFLEVVVKNHRELSDISTVITDIDVLGISVDANGTKRRIIFDCKTLKGVSPINRSFWAAGLMKYVSCDDAYVILKKRSTEAHRLSAKRVNVHLFDETQFSNYAESHSLNFKIDYCYSTNIENWIAYYQVFSKNSFFEKLGQFLNSEVSLEMDATRGIRRLLVALQKGKGELNPDKPEHLAIFQHAVMVFSFFIAQVIQDLKNIVDYDSNQNDFEKLLKYYIWGGKESFNQKQEMRKLFADINQDSSFPDLEISEWPLFLELVRKLLDSPTDIFKCCFPIREISFRNLASKDPKKDIYLAKSIAENTRIRQFLTSQARYLVRATKLPTEFEEMLSSVFDELKLVKPS